MKIKFHGAYVSKNGTSTFRYIVQGTKEELADYKKVQGDNYREDETTKEPLFFGIKRYHDDTPLALRRDGKRYYAVTELLESVVENKVNTFKAMASIKGITATRLIDMMIGGDQDDI